MDINTLVGLPLGTSSLFLQLCLGNQGFNLRILLFWNAPSVLIVFGGTLSTLFIRYTIKDSQVLQEAPRLLLL